MGCRNDHMQQTAQEQATQHAAALLVYVHTKLKTKCPEWVIRLANDYYAPGPRVFPALCKAVTGMSDKERAAIVYNSYDAMSRKLADWWEDHQAKDARRKIAEKDEAATKALRKAALAKLTPAEIKALGLK